MNVKQFLAFAADQNYTWHVPSLVDAAKRHGLHFTADELVTAADELWGNLSEDELHAVVGGGGNGRSDNGPVTIVNPPPPFQDRDTWSPPPGDVSGNSCFFMRSR